jgi:hypothetical protein
MQLQMVLSQDDLIAALQAFLTANGHQMNAVSPPQIMSNGTVVVLLNS